MKTGTKLKLSTTCNIIAASYCIAGSFIFVYLLVDLMVMHRMLGRDLQIPWETRNWLGILSGIGFIGAFYWTYFFYSPDKDTEASKLAE